MATHPFTGARKMKLYDGLFIAAAVFVLAVPVALWFDAAPSVWLTLWCASCVSWLLGEIALIGVQKD